MNTKVKYGLGTALAWTAFIATIFTTKAYLQNRSLIEGADDLIGYTLYGIFSIVTFYFIGHYVRSLYLKEYTFYKQECALLDDKKFYREFNKYFILKRTRLFAVLFLSAIPWYLLGHVDRMLRTNDYILLTIFFILGITCLLLHMYGKKQYSSEE